MAKAKTRFMCDRCGAEAAQWQGKCPACAEWNTMVEITVAEARISTRRVTAPTRPVSAAELDLSWETRLTSGIGEVDRVLGGGLVPGGFVLLSGDPGVGKSTLLLQVAHHFALGQGPCLYVSGEESITQLAMRSRRLGAMNPALLLLAETQVETISQQVEREPPKLLVVDSIQSLSTVEGEGAPGGVTQVRACALHLLRLAKDLGLPTIMIGHVTKDGTLAGPRVLEHMVDTVLTLEGEHHSGYRVLRSTKNRFGSTDELGLFHMTETGLEAVPDASAALLAERRAGMPGSSVAPVVEGTRPMLVEVQALVSQGPPGGTPRRAVTGVDYGRASLILAVLEKRARLPVASSDVFINIPGGVRVTEPAADLAIALAVASSVRDQPLPEAMACVGELGLTGEIRAVPHLSRRLSELSRQGFTRCLVPKQAGAASTSALTVVAVDNLRDAFRDSLGVGRND